MKSEYLGIIFPTTRIEASNSQLPLEPLANSDIPLVVIIDLLLHESMIHKWNSIHKTSSNGPKFAVMIITVSFRILHAVIWQIFWKICEITTLI